MMALRRSQDCSERGGHIPKIELKEEKTMLKRFLTMMKEEEGQGLTEYALIIALVSILAVGALTALSGGINQVFADIVAAF